MKTHSRKKHVSYSAVQKNKFQYLSIANIKNFERASVGLKLLGRL